MEAKKQTVEDYINTFPEETQVLLKKVRKVIQGVVPGAEEVISYGIPTFKVNGRYVVYFSGWKDHISIHPLPKENQALQERMTPYITGKGTLRFSLSKEIPYELIEKVAKQHYKERVTGS